MSMSAPPRALELVDRPLRSHRRFLPQLAAHPCGERVVEDFCSSQRSNTRRIEPSSICSLGRDLEQRVDARLQWALLQEVGAKAMDGADVCLFELFARPLSSRRAYVIVVRILGLDPPRRRLELCFAV